MKDYFSRNMKKYLRRFWEELQDMVFPSNIQCIVCGVPIDIDEKYSICGHCYKKINWQDYAGGYNL